MRASDMVYNRISLNHPVNHDQVLLLLKEIKDLECLFRINALRYIPDVTHENIATALSECGEIEGN